jgi:hypothetical protein
VAYIKQEFKESKTDGSFCDMNLKFTEC